MRICIFHNSQQELKEYRNGITVFYLFLVIVISCHVYGMVYGIWCDGILVTRNMVLNVVLMLFMTNHIHPSQTYHWLMCLLVLVLYLQKLSDCNGNWSFLGTGHQSNGDCFSRCAQKGMLDEAKRDFKWENLVSNEDCGWERHRRHIIDGNTRVIADNSTHARDTQPVQSKLHNWNWRSSLSSRQCHAIGY